MEEAVRVRHDARGRQRDDLIESRRRLDGKLRDETLVDVGVRGGIPLQQILRMADDVDGGGGAFERKRHFDIDGHRRSHVDIPIVARKSLGAYRQVIRIRRQITKDEPAIRVCSRGSSQSGDGVTQLDGDRYHSAPGRIFDRSLDRASAAEFLAHAGEGTQEDSCEQPGDPRERALPDSSALHEASFQNAVVPKA